jgi:hypothetical protein
MLRRVALVRTDVSEELSASFILVTLMKEALSSSEASVHTRATRFDSDVGFCLRTLRIHHYRFQIIKMAVLL